MSGTIFHDDVPFGGATSVDTLVDVNLGENGPSDGDILVYDSETGMWKPSGNLSTLNSKIAEQTVNTSAGTHSSKWTEIFNAIDMTKISARSSIITGDGVIFKVYAIAPNYIGAVHIENSYSSGGANGLRIYSVDASGSGATYNYVNAVAGGITVTNQSSGAVAADTVTIAY
jgi:hypothetical protein